MKLDVCLQIASTMAYLHSLRICHRDLKPQNILMAAENQVKVADFGLANVGDSSHSSMATFAGTISYMDPVILRGESHYTNAADVYSFGVMMNEILSGEAPYKSSENQFQIMFGVGSGFLGIEIPSSLPEGIQALISSCISRDPKLRPTFVDIVEQIQNVLEQSIQNLEETPA